MKVLYFLPAFLFLLSSQLSAQTDSINVPFVAYWSLGDTYNFQVTKIKSKWQQDVLSKSDTSKYIVNFEVIDSTESSYKIKWSFKNDLKSTYRISEKLLDKLKKYETTEVIYTTNHLGTFEGIENWKEISDIMIAMFNDIIELSAKEDESKNMEGFKRALKPVMEIYSSKEGVEQLIFKELMYFHFPFGMEFSANETFFYEDQLPNMLGGAPIKGDAQIYFESVDTANSHCVMIQEMSLDPQDAKDLVLRLFKKMGMKSKEMNKAMANAVMDIKDNNRFEYYYYPGVPLKINTNRETFVDMQGEKARSIDQTIIELLDE